MLKQSIIRNNLADIARHQDTDKSLSQGYIENFERHFARLREQPTALLELGVFHGGSLRMWHEYFQNGLVVGLDINANPLEILPERMRFYRGSQDDVQLLERIAEECAPTGFDIIIDDAAHIGTLSRASFRALFSRHLKSGGIYVLEDWGTGYWDAWPDGKSYRPAEMPHGPQPHLADHHLTIAKKLARRWTTQDSNTRTDPHFSCHNHGMVGFVKELVDEVGWPDITFPFRGNDELARRPSLIKELIIYTGQAFVIKT
jgi:SAM-dependent methyltransferase